MEDLSQEFLIENSSENMEFLENKTEEVTTGAYLLSIAKIVTSVQRIRIDVLLIVNN